MSYLNIIFFSFLSVFALINLWLARIAIVNRMINFAVVEEIYNCQKSNDEFFKTYYVGWAAFFKLNAWWNYKKLRRSSAYIFYNL